MFSLKIAVIAKLLYDMILRIMNLVIGGGKKVEEKMREK